MYTRVDLQASGKAYANAVRQREITIFTAYIADGIVTYAKKGLLDIKFHLLDKYDNIQHNSDGILNKYDPGPIPLIYIDEVVARLRISFPDTYFVIGDSFLFVSWG
jgi:hypothetical protein